MTTIAKTNGLETVDNDINIFSSNFYEKIKLLQCVDSNKPNYSKPDINFITFYNKNFKIYSNIFEECNLYLGLKSHKYSVAKYDDFCRFTICLKGREEDFVDIDIYYNGQCYINHKIVLIGSSYEFEIVDFGPNHFGNIAKLLLNIESDTNKSSLNKNIKFFFGCLSELFSDCCIVLQNC